MSDLEIENIKSDMAELKRRQSEADSFLGGLKDGSAEFDEASIADRLFPILGNDNGAPLPQETPSEGLGEAMPPFSVFYEYTPDGTRGAGFYIYVPEGCVLVDGVKAEIGDGDTQTPDDDDCIPLDLGSDNAEKTVYAHVIEKEESGDEKEYYVIFDTLKENDDSIYDFKVAIFENGAGYIRVCSSLVSLGGSSGSRKPLPYEVRVYDYDCHTKGLKIWLPDTPILVYDGQEIDPRTGLQPTVDSPEGWYDLDMNYGTLYLCIDLAEMSAELTFSECSQCDVRIKIAEVKLDCEYTCGCECGCGHVVQTIKVVQYVCSALIFNQRAKPLPYEVRMLPGENYPAIWLPGDPILVYGQKEIDVTYGLVPVQGAAEGWYSLPMSLGDVWLHLDTLGPRAQISSSGPSCVSTELCYRIATIEDNGTCCQCGTSTFEVKQYIDSAVIVTDGNVKVPSVYEIVEEDNCGGCGQGESTRKFVNRYYELSGVLREGPDGNPENYHGQFLAIVITGTSSYTSASLVGYSTFSALNSAMKDQSRVVMPLYKFNSTGGVECDFRHVPRADAWSLWGTI